MRIGGVDRRIPWFGVGFSVIVLLALGLRLYGIRWGLPNELHAHTYHPDEWLILGSAFVVVYLERTLNPRFFNYPSLFIYFTSLAIAIALGYGLEPELDNLYLTSRIITVAMAVGAVAAVIWAGSVLFGKQLGLLAGVVLTIAPLHVQHSHFATVDVPSTLFVALCLGFAGLIMKYPSWRNYLLAGAMAGLAAGTKYNAGLVILAPIAAHIISQNFRLSVVKSKKAWAMLGATIAAFIISTPGSILFTHDFWQGITYEMRHAAEGHGLVFTDTGPGIIYSFASSLWYGLGPTLAVLFAVAVIWTLIKRNKSVLVLMTFIVPYYALISISEVRFARYTLPLFPAVALLVSWLFFDWWQRAKVHRSVLRGAWIGVVAIMLATTLLYTGAILVPFDSPDPRDQAARWILNNIPGGTEIGLVDYPWFYTPPLSEEFGFGTLPRRRETVNDTPYQIVVFSECVEQGCWYGDEPPEYVIVSDYETRDALRLKDDLAALTPEQREEVERILADLELVKQHYEPVKTFGGWFDRIGFESMPHDMRYSAPSITIYKQES